MSQTTHVKKIPYGKQTLDQSDLEAVLEILEKNTYLTTGPVVSEFEEKVSQYVGCDYAVAVSSATAGLHAAANALDLKPTDEVIVPAISFVATSNAVLYCNAKPVFCDVGDDINIDTSKIEELINERTKAIICVDYAGQPCNFEILFQICQKHNLKLIDDASHAIGGSYKGVKIGNIADMTVFSFHPVKNITTCEGGMVLTNNKEFYDKIKSFRSHGINLDHSARSKLNSHAYDMTSLGYNYRIPDLLCGLGISQLKRLDSFMEKRQDLVDQYNKNFEAYPDIVQPINLQRECCHHIYVVRILSDKKTRDELFLELKDRGILTNVHYKPIYLHTFYRELGYSQGLCPNAEKLYQEILTLPLFPELTMDEVTLISNTILELIV